MRLSVLFDLCLFSYTSHPPPTIPSSQFQTLEKSRAATATLASENPLFSISSPTNSEQRQA